MKYKQILEDSESSGHKDFQKSILAEGTASVVPCRSSVLAGEAHGKGKQAVNWKWVFRSLGFYS